MHQVAKDLRPKTLGRRLSPCCSTCHPEALSLARGRVQCWSRWRGCTSLCRFFGRRGLFGLGVGRLAGLGWLIAFKSPPLFHVGQLLGD
eukprot:2209070-Rhodomonas_salina.1